MNRVYKVIYSKARQCAMVVSELARSSHKNSRKGAGHVGTPALARMVAAVLAAGALTWGIVPGVSWAADTASGKGDGVAIGTGSNAPKAENVAIGKGATISYSNGASSATGDIVVGNGANINNYASQGGSIAIGKNAKIENMAGGGEASFAFGQTTFSGGWWSSSRIPADPSKVVGSIAIGDNTFARTGSTMIGSHNYKGELGDTTVDSASTRTDALNVYATTIGANSFSNGAFTTSTGAYNIISSDYNGGRLANPVKNMGATITGALNSIESIKDAGYYSGIANTVSGIANRTSNSNGTLIYGAGNEVTNSITNLTSTPTDSGKSAKEFVEKLRTSIKESKSGGATLVIGGGNKADYTQKTQILGVNNTVTGTEKNISDYNMIDGFGNTITGASHLYTIGTNNKITNTKNTILAGDDYTAVSGLTDSVIIGNNRVRGKDDKAEFAYFSNQKNIVSIGNKNVLNSTDGSISIGNNNFMWRSGGKPDEYGYDTGNVAIGNNTYINSYLNQGDSIVIGKNATAVNMGGTLEQAFAFGTPMGKNYSGSIAIGQNSYARSGSTMIGIHNYHGKLGDLDIDFMKDKSGGPSDIAKYQESIDATTIGNDSYNNGVFSTVVGSYTAVSGLYHNEKWGEKPYGVQNFGAAVLGSLNSVEGLTSTEHNTAGMADSILGSANRTKNANGTIMVGAGNVVEDSIKDFDASEIKTKNGIASPNALSDAMRTSIKNANGGGAAAIVGNGNEVKKSTNVAVMGSKNSVTSTTNSQIFGDNRAVTGADGAPIDGAVIIGSASGTTPMTTDKKNVTILGYNANATAEGGVALGAGSVASMDKASTDAKAIGYDPATKKASTDTSSTWKSTAAAVSVGDASKKITRQITNVAAGTQDTDAVNVAQLKAISNTVDASKMKYYSVQKIPFTETQLGSYAGYTNEANDGAKEMGALAAGYMTYAGGIASTVTGSLSGVINQAAAPGSQDFRGATALSYGTFNINNNSDKSGAFSGVANSIVGQANMTTDSNAALIYGAGNVISNSYRAIDITKMGAITGNLKDPKALGEALQAAVPTSGGQVMAFGGGNVVDNAYMTQVMGVGNTVKGNQKKNTDGTWSSDGNTGFNNDASSQLNYVDGFYTTLINGKNDYLIGAHNTVTGDSVEKNHSNIVIGDNHTLENQSNNIILGSAASALPTTASQVTILGHNANATVEGGVALGSGSIASREAKVAGYDPSTKAASTEISATWKATDAAVSVGKEDGSMTRQITGVAAGSKATDAVNVAQLQKALAGAKDGNDTLKSSTDALKLDGNTLSMNIKDTAGNTVSGSVDLSKFAQAVDTNTTYTLTGRANNDNTTTITLKDSNGEENSVTIATKDTRNTVKAGENVTLDTKDNADGSHEYTVKVKADGKVEAGSTKIVSGDTVYNETRVKQGGTYVKVSNTAGENLTALDNQVTSNTQNINYLNGRVGELGDRINKVGAGAAALAALHPLDFDPDDKWDFAAGVGNYRNATAAAVGLFYRPNERTMFNLGWTMGDNRNMVNGGFSVKFGKSNKYVKYSKAEMASVIDNQSREIAELKAKDVQNAKDNAEMRAEIEALKKQVEALAAKK